MNDDMPRPLRMPWRAAKLAVAAALMTGLLGGCGAMVPGTALVAAPDLAALDVGAWPTSQAVEPPDDNDTYGRVLESVRLGEAVISPPAVDSALAYGGSALLPTAGRAAVLAPEIALDAVANWPMLAGYSVTGTDSAENKPAIGQSKVMRLTVLNFRQDLLARNAAAKIDAADIARNAGNVSIGIPGRRDARSHWRPQIPVLTTTLAYKSYVVVVLVADRTPDAAALTAMTTAALSAELPLLDAFRPTAPDQLSALPLDTDGMLRRLLHPDADRWPYPAASVKGTPAAANWFSFTHGSGVVYGPVGATHLFGRDPSPEVKEVHDGVDRLAFIGDWWLLRVQDAAHARKMHLRVVAAATAKGDIVTAAPEGVPDTACFRGHDASDSLRELRYHCFVLDGRYWAVVAAPDEKTVRQRAAAQYALLVNNR